MSSKPRPVRLNIPAATVPCLLVVVALCQFAAAQLSTLTAWKGGGFGMFATIDGPHRRYFTITAVDARRAVYRVALPRGRVTHPRPLTASSLLKALTFPTEGRLRALAGAVAGAQLVPSVRPQPLLPTRLMHSAYRAPLQEAEGLRPTLEMIAPVRQPGTPAELMEIRVSVLSVTRDPANGAVSVRRLAPEAIAPVQQALRTER